MIDLKIAKMYVSKADNARDNGHDFQLTFNQYKALITKKRCYYSNIPFQHGDKEYGLSLDRIDNSKGYVPGNVVPCLKVVNNIKSALENPTNLLEPKHLKRMCEILIKASKK